MNSNEFDVLKLLDHAMAELSQWDDDNEDEDNDNNNNDDNESISDHPIRETHRPSTIIYRTNSFIAKSLKEPLHLSCFSEIRWVSAWMVMYQFYVMWNGITRLRLMTNDDQYPEFVNAFDSIDKSHLQYVIQLLYPLVEGIDYCQRDLNHSVDGMVIINKLRDYYLGKKIPGLEKEEVEKVFSERLGLFYRRSDVLHELFSLPVDRTLNKDKMDMLMNKCIDELKQFTNLGLSNQEIENIAYFEIPLFVKSGKMRDGLTVPGFFCSYNNRSLDTKFVLLPRVYGQVETENTLSAAVERTFSEQVLIQTSRQRLLKTRNVNNLMMIKCNWKFSEGQGMEEQLRKHLFDNNPLKDLLRK